MKDLKTIIDVDDNDEFENSALEELSGNDRDSEKSDEPDEDDSEQSDQEESDEPPKKNELEMIWKNLTRKNLILRVIWFI